jgi:nickel-type superoxide dismutase maturation protease
MRERYHGLSKGLFPGLVAGALLWWIWRPFRVAVEGTSMSPTLEPGEWLVAVKARSIRPGALVVIEHPARPGYEMVKRVAAFPGDRPSDRALGPDEYWVIGDNEDASTDSRSFGPLGRDAIRGRVVLRYWPARRGAWISSNPPSPSS